MKFTNDQFRVRVDSHRQIAAADFPANDERPVPGDVKSPPRVRPRQGTCASNDGRAVPQTNLATMRVTGEGNGILLIALQHKA